MTKSERSCDIKDSFWTGSVASLAREESESAPVYDLEERTARFGEAIIDFAKRIPRGPLTDRIIDQLVGAGTSVGANYIETDDSVSKKEFLKCIGTCKKESRETKHFLRMVVRAVLELQGDARQLWMEARALHLIFARIWRTGKTNGKMTKLETRILRHSSFGFPSSSGIRHSSFSAFLIRHSSFS